VKRPGWFYLLAAVDVVWIAHQATFSSDRTVRVIAFIALSVAACLATFMVWALSRMADKQKEMIGVLQEWLSISPAEADAATEDPS
jgi:uncharacterized membrane protein